MNKVITLLKSHWLLNLIIGLIIGFLASNVPLARVILDETIRSLLFGNIVLVIAALIAAILIHELGHALAAVLIRRRITWISIGPVFWLRLTWHRGLFWGKPFPGSLGSVASLVREDEVDRIFPAAFYLLAGVIANLFTIPLGYEASLLTDSGYMSQFFQNLVGISAFLSITNLLPIGHSDGAQLFKLFGSKGVNHEHLAEQSLHSLILEGVTPCQWPDQTIDILHQSSEPERKSFALLLDAEKALTSGALHKAEILIDALELQLPKSSPQIAKMYHMLRTELLVLSGKPKLAKQTLKLALPYHMPASVWLAEAEIALAEGREQEAHKLANKAIRYLSKCPWARGYYNSLKKRWSNISLTEISI